MSFISPINDLGRVDILLTSSLLLLRLIVEKLFTNESIGVPLLVHA